MFIKPILKTLNLFSLQSTANHISANFFQSFSCYFSWGPRGQTLSTDS